MTVDGMLALMAGGMIDELGRRNLDMMAERLQNRLREDTAADAVSLEPGSLT